MGVTVALTGASGFIGSVVLHHLSAAGFRVRALYRRLPAPTALPAGAVVVQGELSDALSLARLLDGVSCIVHCAGLVKSADNDDFRRVNAEGTARLLQETRRIAPAARGILVSSLAARHPGLSPYAASKRAAEELLRGDFGDLPWVILRPPATYGPGDRELEPLWRAMRRGILPVPGNGRQRLSLLHVEDLADAVTALLVDRPDRQPPIELHDGKSNGYGWADLARAGETVFQRRIYCLRIPAWSMQIAAHLNLGAARLLHYAPMLTPGKVSELLYPSWVCDNSGMSRCTEWTPQRSLTQGLRAQRLVP